MTLCNLASVVALVLSVSVSLSARAAGSLASATVSVARGSDTTGCGAATSPCKTFQYAFANAVEVGGTILVLDPGDYGPISINNAVAIVNANVGAAGVFTANSTGNAIDVNLSGGSGNVVLDGLRIDGAATGVATKGNGVAMTSGGSLTIRNCTITNFAANGMKTGNGVYIAPTSGIASYSFSHTSFADNGNGGVFVAPNFGASGSAGARGVVRNVTMNGAGYGFYAYANNTSAPVVATIEDSVVAWNTNGVIVRGATANVTVNRVLAQFNKTYDLWNASGVLTSDRTNDFATRFGSITYTHLK
ncbi:MAG: hypothetical protein QM651_04425 [Rhodoblastus sp.]